MICVQDLLHLTSPTSNLVPCDISLQIENQIVCCHREYLASQSEFFHRLFTVDTADREKQVIALPNLTWVATTIILEYIYSGTASLSPENVEEVIEAVDYLQIDHLKTLSSQFCIENVLCYENALYYLEYAETYSCLTLEEASVSALCNNFLKLKKAEEFMTLSVKKLCKVLCSDELYVDSEVEVFEAIVQWTEHDPLSRKWHFSFLFSNVRIGCIPQGCLSSYFLGHYLLNSFPSCIQAVSDMLTSQPEDASYDNIQCRPRLSLMRETVMLTGGAEFLSNSCLCFVPSSDTWYKISGKLSCRQVFLSDHGLGKCGSYIYVAGGAMGLGVPKSCFSKMNLCNGNWSALPNMPFGRKGMGLAILGKFIYCVGGGYFKDQSSRSVNRYSIDKNTWSEVAPLNTPRYRPCVVSFSECIFAIGDSMQDKRTAEKYVISENQWVFIRPPLHCITDCSCSTVSGKSVILYNDKQRGKLTFDVYDMENDTWEVLTVAKFNPFIEVSLRHEVKTAVIDDLLYIFDLGEVHSPKEEEEENEIQKKLSLWIYDKNTGKLSKKYAIDASCLNLHVMCQSITVKLSTIFLKSLKIMYKY